MSTTEWAGAPEQTSWVSVGEQEAEWLLDVWPSAGSLTQEAFAQYLVASQAQCIEYLGGRWTPAAYISESWRLAQVLQARALMRSADSDTDNGLGPEGISVTVFPMDWTVKRLLVPERRIGGIA